MHKSAQGRYLGENEDDEESFFTDWQYRRGGFNPRSRGGQRFNRSSYSSRNQSRNPSRGPMRQKRCFVCDEERCWSTNHSSKEQEDSKKRWGDRHPKYKNRSGYERNLRQYIANYEGDDEDEDEIVHFFGDLSIEAKDPSLDAEVATEMFHTSIGTLHAVESINAINMLTNKAFEHHITWSDNTIAPVSVPYSFITSTDTRYDESEFKGLLIDSGAATRSTGGIGQLKALQKIISIKLDETTAGSANFVFGIGSTSSIGTVNLNTPIGRIVFHIVRVNTPFLLCLADMDKLGAFFNNLTNQVVQAQHTHPVIRRYGHAFLLWCTCAYALAIESFSENPCFLTTTELRRLHRRFGHPSVSRLHRILERSGHDVDLRALEYLVKYCHHCQKHGKSPGRFGFTIKDDVEFNYHIVVDILYIEGKAVLQLVDEATRFQAGRWLKDISARHVWDQLRACWIDTYLGPPDLISADAGKQFMAREFRQYAANMGIIVKNVPVEAHHSIGLVERYHGPLRRAYSIITAEIPGIEPELALQMAFKALNDSVGPNGLVPTLLVFGAYPRMTEMDAPSPTITQRTIAMRKAMEEVRKLHASRQVNDALNTRNGPSTTLIHDLPINSPVLVFREGNAGRSGTWKGPYKLLSLQGESAIIELSSGPTKFRSTSLKPYYDLAADGMKDTNKDEKDDESAGDADVGAGRIDDGTGDASSINPRTSGHVPSIDARDTPPTNPLVSGIIAPTASPSSAPSAPVKRGRGRPRKHPEHVNFTTPSNICFVIDTPEDNDDDISKLPQFTSSRQKEVAGLLEKGVFKLVNSEDVPDDARVFNSRFVDEIKNPGTDKAFEKSRLVVQAYNDLNKDLVLTQSPTIQRVSQRLIICLTATFQNESTKLYLRDVTQAYVQSNSELNRDFYIRPPHELTAMMGAPSNCILKVIKPLYGVPEAGNHWFATYHAHHTRKLGMTESTYDPCLLYKSEPFGIVGLQTDDTLMLASDTFSAEEEDAIKKAKIMTKERTHLILETPIKFNGTMIRLAPSRDIMLTQETRVGSISLVKNHDASTTSSRGIVREKLSSREQYVAQRARGAYTASICQPEASFDLSYAAQSTKFSSDDINALNKRLKWQIENQSRGLK